MEKLVRIKSSKYGLDVHLHPEAPFEELLSAVKNKFNESAKFFQGAKMAVSFLGRSITRSEEETLIQVIEDTVGIEIICVIDKDENSEVFYRNIIEQCMEDSAKRDGRFYKGTLKKRQVLESESSIIVLGDVERGAKVIAKENIVILGELDGSAYAGAGGNRNAFIVALGMNPKNLRIADMVAKKQMVYQESSTIKGPKIALIDGSHIYVDPLTE
ncbi:MAG: septum site-determining protein MinC [Hespellia sp.]|nr:septum site-determining protein MinC [Hespellia sp.]